MTDEAPPDLDQAIRDALAAARAANDAAQDLDAQQAASQALIRQMARGQRRLGLLAGGACIGALLAAAVAGLVYLRSVADLREMTELQVATTQAMLEPLHGLTAATAEAAALPAALADMEDRMVKEILGHVDATLGAQPDGSAGLQAHFDTTLAAMRDDVIAALADVELALAAAPAAGAAPPSPELATLLSDLRTELRRSAGQARADVAPAPAAARKAAVRPKARRAPAVAENPFRYP